MLDFEVNDMTCGHCVAAITKAVQAASPGAVVNIDLSRHRVQVDGASDPDAIIAAIRDAGYSPSHQS
ncbi:heavy metal transporter [Pollutimonas nitritireducens]|uniref:Heavy metal transporter n=1 Tax=Pollutimonas nitritireducens TaxID=2045209 RepID=A0A2N4UGS5_9BURK|nr:heavy-metal-associated domain-containing protein [Pollutimonas nitritireducens]PLC54219.1 heavy metal transporter [Pollutimonas nitritireducens]